MYNERKPRFEDIASDRLAHETQADIPDFEHVDSCVRRKEF
jgi:hypothetical protein